MDRRLVLQLRMSPAYEVLVGISIYAWYKSSMGM